MLATNCCASKAQLPGGEAQDRPSLSCEVQKVANLFPGDAYVGDIAESTSHPIATMRQEFLSLKPEAEPLAFLVKGAQGASSTGWLSDGG